MLWEFQGQLAQPRALVCLDVVLYHFSKFCRRYVVCPGMRERAKLVGGDGHIKNDASVISGNFYSGSSFV